jgi:type III restriction enzyme
MPRGKSKINASQTELIDKTPLLKTAPCVPAIREAVASWRAGNYKGITETSRILLNYWFKTDHKPKPNGISKYYDFQREAMETIIYLWEFEKVYRAKDLIERYARTTEDLRLLQYDEFPRYCVKMATGSGKTKVMSLCVVWQYLNACREQNPEIAEKYAKTFLIFAPNVIVYERLKTDFESGKIFRFDPLIPKEMEIFWDLDCVLRETSQRPPSDGMLYLTNIQQLHERPDRKKSQETEQMTDVLGPKPPTQKLESSNIKQQIALRNGPLMIINDEAHHTHDEDLKWNEIIRDIHKSNPLNLQLDFTATPRFQKGALFPWTIFDYPLKQAIIDGIVKKPIKGIADIEESKSRLARKKYQGWLVAGVERWKEYRDNLKPLQKKPVLFIMLNTTDEAEDIGDWLRVTYPEDFSGDKTQVIHTDTKGEISKSELDAARVAVRQVDSNDNPINAIVSVLMLREGWDVKNVTVVVGLRPYSAKANILPEQTIGRGLRKMFGSGIDSYIERVDVIGNKAFLDFVDDLEKLEEIQFDTFKIGKDKVKIITIMPLPEKNNYDIGIPVISPSLIRKKSIAQELAAIDIMKFPDCKLPLDSDPLSEKEFRYDGYDIISMEKLIERKYPLHEAQTAQEIISYYSGLIAEKINLPSQFAAIAPLVRDFFEYKAFGKRVDLTDSTTVRAMGSKVSEFVCIDIFSKILKKLALEQSEPALLNPKRLLSTTPPFPWSQPILEAKHTIFNLVPCVNDFEKRFARFLDLASDVKAFAKLPMEFAFSIEYTDSSNNLRYYYPDFIAIDKDNTHWIIETKGREDEKVQFKDRAATIWCENASALSNTKWKYIKIPQHIFDNLGPSKLTDIVSVQGNLI